MRAGGGLGVGVLVVWTVIATGTAVSLLALPDLSVQLSSLIP
jgi:hypothetical protein